MASQPDGDRLSLTSLQNLERAVAPRAYVSLQGHTAAGVMTRMFSAAGRALVALLSALLAPALLGILRVMVTGALAVRR